MPKSKNQKLKLLYIKDILYKYTDSEHPLNAADIIAILKDVDIEAERKSIYNDVEMLAAYGYDILKINGRDGGYFIGSREFELAELKMLIDAVMSSRFITKKKSEQLVKKISELASEYDSEHLKRSVYSINRIKSQNESILYIVDDINEAIRGNKKISFNYLEWTVDLKLKPRKNGELYLVSPKALIWDDEYYYLVAFDEDGNLRHYRVDKIREVTVCKEDAIKAEVNLEDYNGKVFGMFGGEAKVVAIECPNEKIGILIDKLGQNITITTKDENTSVVHAEVVLSNQFYGWMASVGPNIKLTGSKDAVNEYRNFLMSNLNAI